MEQEDYDDYLKIRENAESIAEDSTKDLDKKTYTTATGTLGLSLALLTYMGHSTHMLVLVSSWICIAIAILLNMYSHILSKRSATKAIKSIDGDIKNNTEFNHERVNKPISKRNKRIRILNWTVFATTWAGVILLIIFITLNNTTMSKENPRGAKPPQPATIKIVHPATGITNMGVEVRTAPPPRPKTVPKK